MARYVEWEKVVSANLCPPAVPMTAVTLWIDAETGAIGERTAPVLGVLVEVVEQYVRAAGGPHDCGDPRLPPGAAALAREGYTFSDRRTRMSYVTHDDEFDSPESHEDARACNAEVFYHPTGGGPPAWRRAEAEDRLRARLADREAGA